jgi:YbbR domain-containing protein
MPLRALILNHLWLKLFSLVLATLIWFTVQSNVGLGARDVIRPFSNRPILVLTDTAEHVAVVASPAQANVTVRGPAALMQELSEQDIHLYVRLNDRRQMGGELPVYAHVPSGASIVRISPHTATIKPADAR